MPSAEPQFQSDAAQRRQSRDNLPFSHFQGLRGFRITPVFPKRGFDSTKSPAATAIRVDILTFYRQSGKMICLGASIALG